MGSSSPLHSWPFYLWLLAAPLNLRASLKVISVFEIRSTKRSSRSSTPCLRRCQSARRDDERGRWGDTRTCGGRLTSRKTPAHLWTRLGFWRTGDGTMSATDESTLLTAVDDRDAARVKVLLASIPVTETRTLGRALQRAALKAPHPGSIEIARALLDAGADVDFRDDDGPYTPLANAVTARNVDLIRVLVAAGADPTVAYGSECSAVECCIYGGTGRAEIAAELDKSRPKRFDGNTLIAAVDLEATHLARQALDAGVDPNSKDRDGLSALLVAVQTGKVGAVDLLLTYGASPDAVKEDPSMMRGNSALRAAVEFSAIDSAASQEMVRCLIAAGANVNLPTWRGYDQVRPLDVAEEAGASAVVQLLREAGAVTTVDQPDPWGELDKA